MSTPKYNLRAVEKATLCDLLDSTVGNSDKRYLLFVTEAGYCVTDVKLEITTKFKNSELNMLLSDYLINGITEDDEERENLVKSYLADCRINLFKLTNIVLGKNATDLYYHLNYSYRSAIITESSPEGILSCTFYNDHSEVKLVVTEACVRIKDDNVSSVTRLLDKWADDLVEFNKIFNVATGSTVVTSYGMDIDFDKLDRIYKKLKNVFNNRNCRYQAGDSGDILKINGIEFILTADGQLEVGLKLGDRMADDVIMDNINDYIKPTWLTFIYTLRCVENDLRE